MKKFLAILTILIGFVFFCGMADAQQRVPNPFAPGNRGRNPQGYGQYRNGYPPGYGQYQGGIYQRGYGYPNGNYGGKNGFYAGNRNVRRPHKYFRPPIPRQHAKNRCRRNNSCTQFPFPNFNNNCSQNNNCGQNYPPQRPPVIYRDRVQVVEKEVPVPVPVEKPAKPKTKIVTRTKIIREKCKECCPKITINNNNNLGSGNLQQGANQAPAQPNGRKLLPAEQGITLREAIHKF